MKTIEEIPAGGKGGIKYEHILISVRIAHNRGIGQFDDTCAGHIERQMKDYQGILKVDACAMYRHCSYEQHTEGCECGYCVEVRNGVDNHPDET